jgi:ketosteroid isomerase-like protein
VSQENVEIVRRGLVAYNAKDVKAFADLTTSDFEWYPAVAGAVERHSYQGREGIETYFREVSDTWQEVQALTEDVRVLGSRVVVLGRFEGRGRDSGILVDSPQGIIYDLRGGKISRIRAYLDHGEALRAAGLEE